jgi:hypothetical protein
MSTFLYGLGSLFSNRTLNIVRTVGITPFTPTPKKSKMKKKNRTFIILLVQSFGALLLFVEFFFTAAISI